MQIGTMFYRCFADVMNIDQSVSHKEPVSLTLPHRVLRWRINGDITGFIRNKLYGHTLTILI